MTPSPADLLARHRITPEGHVEAWSIQARFGAVLLVVGLAMGVPWLDMLLGGARPEGFWVLGGMAGFVLLFGLAILRVRETLRIDDAGVHHEVRMPFGSRRWRAPREAISRIALRAIVDTSADRHTPDFNVCIDLAIEDHATSFAILKTGSEPRARRSAEAVARALRVPLVDAIGDEEKELDPEAPDRARPEREAPQGPPPDRVEQDLSGERPALVIRGTMQPHVARRHRIAGWGFLGFAATVGALASPLMEAAWLGWVIPFPFWGAGLYFHACALAGERTRERLRVDGADLVRELALAGRRWRRGGVPRERVRQLRIQTDTADARGVAIVAEEGRLVVGGGLEPEALPWIRAWISQQLG